MNQRINITRPIPATLRSRSGGVFGKILFVIVALAVTLVGFGYANVFLTRQKINQIIANIPSNMEKADKKRIEKYIVQQIRLDTQVEADTLKVRVAKSKGMVEVEIRYEVPVNLQVTQYNAKVVQKGERLLGAETGTTSDGRKIKKRSSSFSEHTETYSIP